MPSQTSLAVDREVRRDDDGTIHFTSDCGIPLGMRVWQRTPVVYSPDPVNAADNVKRLNQHRRWRVKARPKTINHVVWRVQNFEDVVGVLPRSARLQDERLPDRRRHLRPFSRHEPAPRRLLPAVRRARPAAAPHRFRSRLLRRRRRRRIVRRVELHGAARDGATRSAGRVATASRRRCSATCSHRAAVWRSTARTPITWTTTGCRAVGNVPSAASCGPARSSHSFPKRSSGTSHSTRPTSPMAACPQSRANDSAPESQGATDAASSSSARGSPVCPLPLASPGKASRSTSSKPILRRNAQGRASVCSATRCERSASWTSPTRVSTPDTGSTRSTSSTVTAT